ncbi:hypothetical protein TH53_07570 [Pedobacter lusitanus]|uniref:Contig29, whole genome shotgun sequence n=1 Tax=Pedobacter lusitanus TaxID=1503925 RepID=A0A0D0FZ23_9SPHI|nr:hypothetical protein [Pedobacter lusitanus]KIO77774.1 hypothetical protein TH53_07570 [Pedobacter lusitanus]
MAKTFWISESDILTIYPARIARRLSIIYFIGFTMLNIFLYASKTLGSINSALIFEGVIVLLSLLVFFIGERNVIFDAESRQLSAKIFGITTSTIPFDQIAAITPYDTMGAISYRVFSKSDRHGKGIPISCGYAKQNNPNLIAYEQEVLPRINELVFSNRPLYVKQVIYDFEFFKEENGVYKITHNKLAGMIFGFLLIALTIFILFHPGFMVNEPGYKRILVTYFPLIIGLVLVNAFFSSVSFDKNNRQIIDTTLGGLIKKVYSFDDFIQFQIVRKSTNFIYTDTEVKALIAIANKGKTKQLMLINFRRTKKIERFIDEANTILGLQEQFTGHS